MSARSIRRDHERAVERERKRSLRRGRAKTFAGAASAAVGAAALFAPAASADTFTVTKTADTDDGTCNADCSLREAAEEANSLDGADVITFASNVTGTIALDDSLGQINLYGDGLDIQGPGAGVLAVDGGDHDFIFKLFSFDQANTQVRISGLTLSNGSVSGGGGGAIRSYEGGSYAADLTVADAVLTSNEANGTDGDGGAIGMLYGDLTITNSTLSNNYAGNDGGAVGIDEGSLTITGSTISGNDSDSEGGGIYVQDTPGGATDVHIADSRLSGNESVDDEGGAIYLDSIDGDALIERSTISGNTAYDEGGGIYVAGNVGGGVTVDSSTFSGNNAEDGAGIYLDEVDESVTIRNSTVSGNDALYDGGGIGISSDGDADEDIEIRNSTIAANSTDNGIDASGGGLYQSVYYGGGVGEVDNVAISSTIIANNSSPVGPDVAQEDEPIDEGAISAAFSLIETTGAAAITSTGPNLTGVDPQLGPLQNNGGPTETHAPSFSSPVIDKGVGNGLGADQRGAPRTFDASNVANSAGGDGTDVGSVELLPGNKLSLAQCKGATENVLFAPGAAIVGSDANDVIVGTSANDSINAGKGNDLVCAGGGNDNAKGSGGKDKVFGEAGKDKLGGNGGKDNVKGGGGKDNIKGGGGKDKLAGQAGADTLKGGGGADKLKGGGGKDKLIGGPGKDKLNGGGGKDSETQ